jgi:hypothetical protein
LSEALRRSGKGHEVVRSAGFSVHLMGRGNITSDKEKVMAEKGCVEGGIRYYQAKAKDFTPITVCADFGALERLQSMKKNMSDSSKKVDSKTAKA